MEFQITAIYAAVLGLMTAGLGCMVVVQRAKLDISWGDGGNEGLMRTIRAHGNLIEYAPVFLVILAILEAQGTGTTWLHGLGLAFVAGRVFSALYFLAVQAFALRAIALWGAILPIIIGAVLLLL